jgi:hypothetical protein
MQAGRGRQRQSWRLVGRKAEAGRGKKKGRQACLDSEAGKVAVACTPAGWQARRQRRAGRQWQAGRQRQSEAGMQAEAVRQAGC